MLTVAMNDPIGSSGTLQPVNLSSIKYIEYLFECLNRNLNVIDHANYISYRVIA